MYSVVNIYEFVDSLDKYNGVRRVLFSYQVFLVVSKLVKLIWEVFRETCGGYLHIL